MSKLRSVSTAFWSDPFIEELSTSEKLLYLYLITNEKTNMLGIYEVSFKKISFETGINKDVIEKAFKGFERLSKVKYVNNHVVLINFMKHQNFNTNMKKSAIDVYNNLPEVLKVQGLKIDKSNPLEGFERLLKGLGMVPKVEVEVEVEDESKREEEAKKEYEYSFDIFWNNYDYKIGKETALKSWAKLTNEEKEKIKDTVKQFKAFKPFKDYNHPQPTTYLNQKRFNDEIKIKEKEISAISFDTNR